MGLKETGWNPTGFVSSEGLQVERPPHTVYKRACCATPPRIQRGRKCECVWVGDGVENKWIIQLNQPWNLACGQCSLKQRGQVNSGSGNFCAHAHKFVVCVWVFVVCVCECECVFCESHPVVIHFISWGRRLLSYSDSEIYQSFFLNKVYS